MCPTDVANACMRRPPEKNCRDTFNKSSLDRWRHRAPFYHLLSVTYICSPRARSSLLGSGGGIVGVTNTGRLFSLSFFGVTDVTCARTFQTTGKVFEILWDETTQVQRRSKVVPVTKDNPLSTVRRPALVAQPSRASLPRNSAAHVGARRTIVW